MQRRGRFALLLRFAVQGGPSWPTRSTARSLRFAILLRLGTGRNRPRLRRSRRPTPLTHWTFVSLRLALAHIGEPTEPPPIAPARPCAAQSCSAWVPAQTILVWSFAAPSQLTHPAGTMIASRCRTSTSLPKPTPVSSLINASPGNRHLLPSMAPPPLIRLPAAPGDLPANPAEARSDTSEMSAALSLAL